MSENVHRRQGTPAALVASLFGIAGRSDLPGPALVALLGDLGLREQAARRALARMRAAGQLRTVRRGRIVDHHLAGAFGASVQRLSAGRGDRPTWDGTFHTVLHQVPESARPYRDRLRRAAVLVGYGPWQPGVLISPVDRSAGLADVLADAPAEASVVLGRLVPDGGWVGQAARERGGPLTPSVSGVPPLTPGGPAVAAAMARRAWALDDLGDDLRVHLDRLTDLLDEPVPEAGAAALRRVSDVTNPVYVDLLRDPGLPPDLLPADWPGPALWRAIGQVAQAHLPRVAAHVRARVAALGGTVDGATPTSP